MCVHVWTYRNGRSECLRCHRTEVDTCGLPHGHYAINGNALTASRIQAGYACPVCYADINPRVVMGALKILCAGPGAHDIEALGRAIPKDKRDYIVAQQKVDAIDVLYGLKGAANMPILDLQQDAGARLKRAGVIRLGVKKQAKSGKMYPTETPYFVLKDAPGLVEIYGAQPKRLNIWLPFNEVDRNLIAWHQLWVAGGLLCRGDGQQIEYAVNPENGEVIVRKGHATVTGKPANIKMATGHPVKCSGMEHGLYPRCQNCRPNALLIVLIREVPRLAYYQIATSSIHNIVNLTGQMRWVKENIGRLQGVPFILERRPDTISTPGQNGKRVRREKYLLHLEPDPEWVKAMLAEMHRRALPGAEARAELPAPIIDDALVSVEVSELDDDPLWEPVEHYDDEPNGDEPNGDEVEDDAPMLPDVGQLTPAIVAQARTVTVKTGTGPVALGDMDDEQFAATVAWIQRNGNVATHENEARAIAVLLKDLDRMAVNAAAWVGTTLHDEVTTKLFEDTEHAIAALSRSWVVTFESDPETVTEWARHYRSARDVGDGQMNAVGFADEKVSKEKQ